MAIMFAGTGPVRGDRLPGFARIAAVWIFSALSFWSKEDFLPAVLLMAAYLTWRAYDDDAPALRGWWIMLAGVALEAALLFCL